MLHVPGSSSILESKLQVKLCLHGFMQAHRAGPLRKPNLNTHCLVFLSWNLSGSPHFTFWMCVKPGRRRWVLLPLQERAIPAWVIESELQKLLRTVRIQRNTSPVWRDDSGCSYVQAFFCLNESFLNRVFSLDLEVFDRQGLALSAPFLLS